MSMQEPGKVYIAGPMTGLPEYNYPAFFEAADRWERMGWEVFNPATHPPIGPKEMHPDVARARFMRIDIPQVMSSDAIAVLPGWENSTGARVEVAVARVLLLPVYDAVTTGLIDLRGVSIA